MPQRPRQATELWSVSSQPTRSRATNRSRRLSCSHPSVPVQDLLTRPEQDTLFLFEIGVDPFEIFDSVRHPADLRMNRDRHHARALRSLSVKGLELVLGPAEKFLSLVVLDDHHRDIVQL